MWLGAFKIIDKTKTCGLKNATINFIYQNETLSKAITNNSFNDKIQMTVNSYLIVTIFTVKWSWKLSRGQVWIDTFICDKVYYLSYIQ